DAPAECDGRGRDDHESDSSLGARVRHGSPQNLVPAARNLEGVHTPCHPTRDELASKFRNYPGISTPVGGVGAEGTARDVGASGMAAATTRPAPPPSARATSARTIGGASAEGSCDRNHVATSPTPPATMNTIAATRTYGATTSGSSARDTRL